VFINNTFLDEKREKHVKNKVVRIYSEVDRTQTSKVATLNREYALCSLGGGAWRILTESVARYGIFRAYIAVCTTVGG
jgi:hypothetical protein